ncbi:hypothetical protein [Methanobrevibacter sp.]|uniref:hypothetical protein n=1 Tax=Methanobrevibacter sp. TaxID=66852 RepID=UPI00388FC560
MKKIPSIMCLVVHILYYILAILSLGDYEYTEGHSTGFKIWIVAMLVAFFCIFLYFILSFYEIILYKDIFYIVNFILITVGIPLLFTVGFHLTVLSSVIWNSYFSIIFIFRIILLFRKERYRK